MKNKKRFKRLMRATSPSWETNLNQYKSHLTQTIVTNSLGAIAFLGAHPSIAQETLMPEVVVTGTQESAAQSYKPESVSSPKYTEPLRDISQTITVIPQSVMQDQGATSMRDVLRNVPGISIQAGEGGVPAGDNLTIRGFSARTDLFIDGVRDFGGYTRDPFNFEQIEVIKGPASSYLGRGSTGGAVNMVSKSPELNPFIAGTLGGGTEQYGRASVDINQPIENNFFEGTALRFNAMYHTSDVANREVVESERWGFAPSITVGLGTPTQLTLSYFHLGQENVPDYGIPWVPNTNVPLAAYSDQPAPVDWSNFYGLKDRDYEKTKTDLLSAIFSHEFSDMVSLRSLLRYGETTRDSIITAPRFVNTTSTSITRTDWKSRDQIDRILSSQNDFTLKFNTAEFEHTLVPGIEFSREQDINYTRVATGSNSAPADFYQPNWDDPYLEDIQRNGAENKSTAHSVGLYAFDTVKLNEQWELNGGVRWDYFDLDYMAVPAPGAGSSTELGRIDRMLSWRGGVVYKPVEQGSIYAAYGTSFNPSAEGLTLSSTATAANNINADPEQTRTWEIGTKWDLFEERLSIALAGFRTEKTNSRTEDPTDSTDTVVLEGEQRVDGIEVGITGSITDKWNVFAAYTFLVSEITESKNASELGNELSNTPNNTFSLWTTYELPMNFEVGAGAQFVGERYSSNANTREAAGYWLGDAMLAYQMNKDVTMRLNVYNLGDAEYIDRVGGGHFIPGAGRSAVLSTDFKF